MKRILIFIVRLLLRSIYTMFIFLTVWMLAKILVYSRVPEIGGSSYASAVAIVITCVFWGIASQRDSLWLQYRNMILVFTLRQELFQNAETALYDTHTVCAAICPTNAGKDCMVDEQKFTYNSENICIASVNSQDDTFYERSVRQLEPLLLCLKHITEKMFELDDGDEVQVVLKLYSDVGYRIQALLNSNSKWTLFFIPNHDKKFVERNYYYRLKPLGDGWYVGVRG